MIKEAYVSYEVAKLLKEKGFDEPCYQKYDDEGYLSSNHVGYINSEKPCDDFCALAPTHQMAMAWLREVHNIFILVGWNPIHKEYFTRILNMTDGCPKRNIYEHASYEDAVEAALKYVLKNLI